MLQIIIPSYQVNPHFKLSKIKIDIKNGEIYSLIGKSGSGKSTVAKLAVGLHLSLDLSIQSNKKEINVNSERLIPQFPLAGYVPQSLHLKPHHTVGEYLELLFQKETNANKLKLTKKYIKLFHIEKILNAKIQLLSGGERQKIALIEAVSKPIEYLILDEPFSQLDSEQKLEFIEIIKALIKESQIPCLLISHDVSDIIRLSNKMGIMEKGKLVFKGDLHAFWQSSNKYAAKLKHAMIQWKEEIDVQIKSLNEL
jgi:ABC-type multidrug transport system ATPase subunit